MQVCCAYDWVPEIGENYYRKETEFNLKSLKTAEPRPTWGGAGGVCEDLLGVTVWLCLALERNESADGGEGFQLPRACGVKGIASEFYLNWETPAGFTLKYITSVWLKSPCTWNLICFFSNHVSSSISKHCFSLLPCHSRNISVFHYQLPNRERSCFRMSSYSVWDVPGNYVYEMSSIGLHNFCQQINLATVIW